MPDRFFRQALSPCFPNLVYTTEQFARRNVRGVEPLIENVLNPLPRVFGYLALLLAAAFAGLGVIFMLRLALPDAVTAFGGVQALWWLAAAVTLIVRGGKFPSIEGKETVTVSSTTAGRP